MTHRTLAVIGHVDHGKTSLVKALTGIDTDRLKEEKKRGLSITLGFAHMDAPNGQIHLVDTPGHADFVRMTSSGLSGADAVLFVVGAVENVQPQTLGHARLAELFGIRSAIVAITKSDLASVSEIAEAKTKSEALLRAHGFDSIEIIVCSSRTQTGLGALRTALERLCTQSRQTAEIKGFFLPIDRVFSVPGAGTIVTGTLLGTAVKVDDVVAIHPIGQSATVRTIQVAGLEQALADAGARVALNLRGIDAAPIRKGHTLCSPGNFAAGRRFDVALTPCAGLKHMEQVTILHGTAHNAARVRLYPAMGNKYQYGQIEFQSPQMAYPGQRFIVRRPATAETLTGGIVIDPDASLVTRNKPAHVSVLHAFAMDSMYAAAHALADRDAGLVDLRMLARSTPEADVRLGPEFETVTTERSYRQKELGLLASNCLQALTHLHSARPCRPFVDMAALVTALRPAPPAMIHFVIARLENAGRLKANVDEVSLTNLDPFDAMSTDQRAAYERADRRLSEMGLRPVVLFDAPNVETSDLEALLIAKVRAVRLFNHSLNQALLLSMDAIRNAELILTAAFPNGESFTTGAARELLDTNRKTIVPLLEYFDKRGVTRRSNDLRTISHSTP